MTGSQSFPADSQIPAESVIKEGSPLSLYTTAPGCASFHNPDHMRRDSEDPPADLRLRKTKRLKELRIVRIDRNRLERRDIRQDGREVRMIDSLMRRYPRAHHLPSLRAIQVSWHFDHAHRIRRVEIETLHEPL